jgi:hypothetical protein
MSDQWIVEDGKARSLFSGCFEPLPLLIALEEQRMPSCPSATSYVGDDRNIHVALPRSAQNVFKMAIRCFPWFADPLLS